LSIWASIPSRSVVEFKYLQVAEHTNLIYRPVAEGYKEDQDGGFIVIHADNLYENTPWYKSNKSVLVLTILFVVGLIATVACVIPGTDNKCYTFNTGWIIAISATACIVFIYIIESFACSATCKYLNSTTDLDGIDAHIDKVKNRPPYIYFSVECYHFETTTTTTRDSNGNTTTSTKTERVTTYTETQPFRYDNWDDISGNIIGVGLLYKITKIRFSKTYIFSDSHTQDRWRAEYRDIQDRNRHRDQCMDAWHGFSIKGYKGRVLTLNDPDNPPPCMALWSYVLCSLSLVGYCYRVWFHSLCTKQRFCYVKRIKCN